LRYRLDTLTVVALVALVALVWLAEVLGDELTVRVVGVRASFAFLAVSTSLSRWLDARTATRSVVEATEVSLCTPTLALANVVAASLALSSALDGARAYGAMTNALLSTLLVSGALWSAHSSRADVTRATALLTYVSLAWPLVRRFSLLIRLLVAFALHFTLMWRVDGRVANAADYGARHIEAVAHARANLCEAQLARVGWSLVVYAPLIVVVAPALLYLDHRRQSALLAYDRASDDEADV
jgi:hypothetical protein